jgi:primosomal protein N' (replication factor Y)
VSEIGGPPLITASVAVPRPVRRLFTYTVPAELVPRCRRGVRVVVPFGQRKVTGYLLELLERGDGEEAPYPLKSVEEVLDPSPVLDESILELTRWAADYYVTSWGEMIKSALPGMQAVLRKTVAITPQGRRVLFGGGGVLVEASLPTIARDPNARDILGILGQFASDRAAGMPLADLKRKIGPRFRSALLTRLRRGGLITISETAASPGPRPRFEKVAALKEGVAGDACQEAGREARLGKRQREILRQLREHGGRAPVPVLLGRAGVGREALRGLERRGIVTIEAIEILRRPASLDLSARPDTPLRPTRDQAAAIESIEGMLNERRFAACLIRGVTGSGKTEVYLRSIEATIAAGGRALYLVPEIGLTPLLSRRLRARFGEVLALLHSGLTEGERYDEWRRIREGRVKVVLGARSAVFAPLPGVGLIVVDEEHDASYKQDEYPRYNGRDLALLRAKRNGAVVILGSATPSMESYRRALEGRFRLLTLPDRIGSAGLPIVERVDMRQEFKDVGRDSILSRRLIRALEERRKRGEQGLILLNRRGFSTFVLCRACGEPIGCRRCSITMTLHLREQRLRCHYCDDRRKVPAACPTCRSGHLHFGGTGTERLEDVMRTHFPDARIERMDRDTTSGRGSVERLLTRMERGEIDILLGTQMIAKGHDFPNVTLVGVLAADAHLGLPDFRAGERTFQLLAQMAGRSGRREQPGEVIVQAYYADHHAIRYAAMHDFEGFAKKELAYRRIMNYPPYSVMTLILVKDRVFDRARASAGTVAQILRQPSSRSLQVLGPAPAPLERLRGDYRVQILVRAGDRRAMREALQGMLAELDRRQIRLENLVIDVDPMSTL